MYDEHTHFFTHSQGGTLLTSYQLKVIFVVVVVVCSFEIGFLYVALAVLEGTHSVNKAGVERGDLPVSASQMLGLKVYASTVLTEWNGF